MSLQSSIYYSFNYTKRNCTILSTILLLFTLVVNVKAQNNNTSELFIIAGLQATNVVGYTSDTPFISMHIGLLKKNHKLTPAFITKYSTEEINFYSNLSIYFQIDSFLESNLYKYSTQKDNIYYILPSFHFENQSPFFKYFNYKNKLKTFLNMGLSLSPYLILRNQINNNIKWKTSTIRPLNVYFGLSSDIKINSDVFFNISYNHFLLSYFPHLIDTESNSLNFFNKTLNNFKISIHHKL